MVKDRRTLKGHDTKTLGPSDSSDSGSDVNPGEPAGSDSDRPGTGEREAGLGHGLDQAEEARRKKSRPGSA